MSKNRNTAPTPEVAFGAADLLSKRIDAAHEAARKLQEATQEANRTIHAAEERTKECAAAEAKLRQMLADESGEIVSTELGKQLELLGKETQKAMRMNVEKVSTEFDELKSVLLGENMDDGHKSISEYIREAGATFSIVWPKLIDYVNSVVALREGCQGETYDDGSPGCPGFPRYAVKFTLKTEDDPEDKNLVGHIHLCVKHKREMESDPEANIVDAFHMEDQICPWKHVTKHNPMIYDEESGRWVDGKVVAVNRAADDE